MRLTPMENSAAVAKDARERAAASSETIGLIVMQMGVECVRSERRAPDADVK